MTMIPLRNGALAPGKIVTRTMVALSTLELTGKSGMDVISALREICRNADYAPPDTVLHILIQNNFLKKDGAPDDFIADIIASSVRGEGSAMQVHSPLDIQKYFANRHGMGKRDGLVANRIELSDIHHAPSVHRR